MAYSELLATRIREALSEIPGVEEKKMFQGITFMVNGKMCVSASGNEMMCRIGPAMHEKMVEENGTREMIKGGKAMKGFLYVDETELKPRKVFDKWIRLCLDFNGEAKASKKKK